MTNHPSDSSPTRPMKSLCRIPPAKRYASALLDLDGVIVDTAKYHYLAWRRLAKELGFDFTERDNERLKGVSRVRSLEILLEIGGLQFDEETRTALAAKKNGWYVDYISNMDASELLPGAIDCLYRMREMRVKTAVCTASKNAPLILNRLGIRAMFDAVVDGNKVSRAKPDPEVFLRGATEVGVAPEDSVVFEDAEAGIEAAKRGGMYAVGVGRAEVLTEADWVVDRLGAIDLVRLYGTA